MKHAVPLMEQTVPTVNRKTPMILLSPGRKKMMNRQFIALICVALVVGLLIGLISFRSYLTTSRQYVSYPVEWEIVHAYFKVFNVTKESGIGHSMMISYVFVLNITNLSDAALRLGHVYISSASVFHYQQYFGDQVNDYNFYPHTSRLVAISQTDGTSGLGMTELEWQRLDYTMIVSLSAIEGRGGGGSANSGQLPLQKISQDEFVYGTTFKPGSYFSSVVKA